MWQESFREFVEMVVLVATEVIDLLAAVIIVYAVVRAFALYLLTRFARPHQPSVQIIRSRLGVAIILGLELLIGADILRTSVAPTWTIIGQLAAIIVLRTVLTYTLESELEHLNKAEEHPDTG